MSFLKWTATIILCLAVFGALALYKVRDIQDAIAEGEAYPEQSERVELARVTKAEFIPTISVMGEVVAPQRLDLRNEIAGEITSVNFQSGDSVEQGQLLIQLDIAIEEANLQAAQARAELASLIYERNLELFETGVASKEQLDQARASLSSARAEITVLERIISKKTLRAPFSGRVGIHNFEVGEYLPDNTLITTLIGDTDYMWVDFQVPQFYPQLPVGTEISLDNISNDVLDTTVVASVIAENTVVNIGNRSRSYRASLASDSRQLPPQTMVNVKTPIAPAEQLLQVPVMAVQSDPLGQYVFVLQDNPSGEGFRAVRQEVEVKTVGSNFTLVDPATGLDEGDLIAAAGAFKLYPGILVFAGERVGDKVNNEDAGESDIMPVNEISAEQQGNY